MLKELFHSPKYATVTAKKEIPAGIMTKCPKCNEIILNNELLKNLKVCRICNYHFKLTAQERLNQILDPGSFVEFDSELRSVDPLGFNGYPEKLMNAQKETSLTEAVVTGEGTIGGYRTVIGVMDPHFISASMGSVVGERITRAMEKALAAELPVVMFCASGGARMQEGILSLMQMAKTSAAVARLNEAGLLYISVMTNPTTGGVTASFASLGDVIIAEPGALIGFAGPRVIEQTIKQKLPPEFQTAEFLLEHGMVDLVVNRKDLAPTLVKLLKWHAKGGR